MKNHLFPFALGGALLCAMPTMAAVTADEAAALKTTLTPIGAERAGNKDGTIPAWTGGYTGAAPAGYKPGGPPVDPFPADKPLYSITPENVSRYVDKLPEGALALFKTYPKTFRIDVYPTRRTAAHPQWVYDNTFKNATRANTTDNGVFFQGAYGGIPFPIPKSGHEAMWNHLLVYQGEAVQRNYYNYLASTSGKLTMISRGAVWYLFPYYQKNGSLETYSGVHTKVALVQSEPAFKAGESFLLHHWTTKLSDAWQYLAGQRRVRKAPTVAYDTPNDVTSGLENYDETAIFAGALDRYNFKIVGKREMIIPYNTNKIHEVASPEKYFVGNHPSPDLLRWELHRVWEVEGTVAEGKRHTVPKRRFYLDEDTWGAVWADLWDAQGKLTRSNFGMPVILFDGGFVHPIAAYGSFNHLTGAAVISGVVDRTVPFWSLTDRKPDSFFTPDALAATGR